MSTVIATSVLPDSTANDTLTFGATGDSVAISGDSLNLNTLQDAGGNSIFVSDGSGTITSSAFGGSQKFISSQSASNSASLVFTSGIDSTYDVYRFTFIDMNPATDNQNFEFQVNAAGQSGYNESVTSLYYAATHFEDDSYSALAYDTGRDQASGTGYQCLFGGCGNGADEAGVGELYLFAPSNTTSIKYWYSSCQMYSGSNASDNSFSGGAFETTSAIDEISFRFASGNIVAGTVKMYGISKT